VSSVQGCHKRLNRLWRATFVYYVYILQSLKDKGLYIGYTSDLKRRIKEHFSGKSFATKSRLPFKFIHYEAFENQTDALEAEKYLKTTRGWKRIHRMLKNSLVQA
jgi:putative endonuclease